MCTIVGNLTDFPALKEF